MNNSRKDSSAGARYQELNASAYFSVGTSILIELGLPIRIDNSKSVNKLR